MSNKEFIRQDNNYRTLKAFQKAECVYDVTYYFANKFLTKGDRTIDQMVQAARSGKQNLAEGNIDGVTSKEMEIKLTQWSFNDPRCVQTREFCKRHLDSAVYREKIKDRSDETIANIAITLIHQCDVLIKGLIEWQKKNFLENGGIKEEMYRARKAYRDSHGFNGQNGFNGSNGQR